VWDGFHRAAAAKLAGVSLLVEVQPGKRQDAEWLALSANQKHGLRRTKADEEWIARTALLKFPVSFQKGHFARKIGLQFRVQIV
jgi:hypothetical protein